jgi:hypothetical protein
MRLLPYGKNKNSFTARQVNELLDNKELPIHNSLTVNTLDSNYSSPEYIASTHHQDNLVNIIRLPSNRNVWKQLTEQEIGDKRKENDDNRGANSVYREEFKLGEVEEWEKEELAEQLRFGTKLANGKKVIVQIDIWEDMMIHRPGNQFLKRRCG